ncbi:MAG: hypothetical protein WCW52_01720 [Elusimicrobiales bacterium]|jgi:hypothetical protein
MFTKSDIADVIFAYLSRGPAAEAKAGARSSGPASKPLPKRVFITDLQMKRLVGPGRKSVKVPAGAIVSPLSQDWLDYGGIEVVRDR